MLLLFTFLINVEIFSQDTVKIPQQELEEFFSALDTLEYQDSINIILIKELESQILNYELLSKQDSLLIEFQKQQFYLQKQQIELHLDRLKIVDRWYHKPWVGFIGGIAATAILIHTIDYSLPK